VSPKILVTGATGTVGYPLVERLADERPVRALVRDPERARGILPPSVELVAGDLADAASVRNATAGCELVFHCAGIPEQWRLDPADFRRANVDGTRNLVEAALAAEVERFVYTSTIDVFAWSPGEPFDESVLDPDPRPTPYERSKQEADRVVADAVERGLPAVFLHPSAVYGPAPVLTPGLNQLLVQLARGEIPMLLPGGLAVVYSDDVADGHLLAAESAPVGARYILSERALTLVELAEAVAGEVPDAKVPRVMPIRIARGVSVAGERIARLTRRPPLIPRGGLHFLESRPVPVADRIRTELRWRATPFPEGLRRALDGFRARGWI
jgi:dihydroflavonol-4-reductase